MAPILDKAKLALVYDLSDEHQQYGGRLNFPGYYGLINSLGVDVLLEESESGYSGDSMLILRAQQSYGFLVFGWGSCSGCDALQRCDKLEEFEELRSHLESSILWFDSLAETISYLNAKDWSLSFLNQDLARDFLISVEHAWPTELIASEIRTTTLDLGPS